jgi:glyoxylase-like metal-dependent hydrolase (beta-lactamase superfamily II)
VNLGNWQLDSVNGGMFRLDGGVMFGVVPKSLWEGIARPDEKNRIRVANHCVLARDGKHTILLDTGYGGKYGPLDRKFYDLEAGEPIVRSLEQLKVSPDAIDTVVFSHLHFDHVGGATHYDSHRQLRLRFLNARHFTGKWEWEDATSLQPELQTAYPINDIEPLRGRICLVEDGDNIVPGLRAVVSGGHTRGHLSLVFESQGEKAIYLGDICPSRAHMRRMWHLAYDTHPLDTRRHKPALLGQAADEGYWVLWNHDPTVAASRVARDPKREFIATDLLAQL